MPRSSIATVEPTGALFCSAKGMSATDANLLPLSTIMPSNCSKVPDGSLNGNGIIDALRSPPGASISLNSPGCNGSDSSLTLIPLALKPAGKFANVPASIN